MPNDDHNAFLDHMGFNDEDERLDLDGLDADPDNY